MKKIIFGLLLLVLPVFAHATYYVQSVATMVAWPTPQVGQFWYVLTPGQFYSFNGTTFPPLIDGQGPITVVPLYTPLPVPTTYNVVITDKTETPTPTFTPTITGTINTPTVTPTATIPQVIVVNTPIPAPTIQNAQQVNAQGTPISFPTPVPQFTAVPAATQQHVFVDQPTATITPSPTPTGSPTPLPTATSVPALVVNVATPNSTIVAGKDIQLTAVAQAAAIATAQAGSAGTPIPTATPYFSTSLVLPNSTPVVVLSGTSSQKISVSSIYFYSGSAVSMVFTGGSSPLTYIGNGFVGDQSNEPFDYIYQTAASAALTATNLSGVTVNANFRLFKQ
jgi:hypothetical protein